MNNGFLNNIPWILNENDRDRRTSYYLIITLKIQTTTKFWLVDDHAPMPSMTIFQTC